MLDACELGRLARREPEDYAREGLKDEILRTIGDHREENEDREEARMRLGPDLRDRLLEGNFRFILRLLQHARTLHTPDREAAHEDGQGAHAPDTTSRREKEKGSRKCPAVPAVTMNPMIIITQTMVAAAGAALVLHALREQHEKGRSARAHADSDHQEGKR